MTAAQFRALIEWPMREVRGLGDVCIDCEAQSDNNGNLEESDEHEVHCHVRQVNQALDAAAQQAEQIEKAIERLGRHNNFRTGSGCSCVTCETAAILRGGDHG